MLKKIVEFSHAVIIFSLALMILKVAFHVVTGTF